MFEFFQKYFSNWIMAVYTGIMLAGLLVGVLKYKKLSKSSRIFFLLLFITLIKEILGYYFALEYRNNSPVSNFFYPIEFGLFSLAFYYNTQLRTYIILPVCLALFSLLNGFLAGQFFTVQDYKTELFAALLYIVSFYLYLIRYFKQVDAWPLYKLPPFWIGLGFTLFYITSIISFGFSEIAHVGEKWHILAFYSMQYSNYFLYLMFIPAFLSPQKNLCDVITNK